MGFENIKGISIKSYLFYGFLIYIFFFIIFGAIVESVQTKSPQPLVDKLGSKFLMVTNDLSEQSKNIISTNVIWDSSKGVFNAFLSAFKVLSSFFSAFIMVFLWIKLLKLIIEHSPLSGGKDNFFTNTLWALILFFVLQIIFILLYQKGSILVPFLAFSDFVRALVHLIMPLSNIEIPDFKSNLT